MDLPESVLYGMLNCDFF